MTYVRPDFSCFFLLSVFLALFLSSLLFLLICFSKNFERTTLLYFFFRIISMRFAFVIRSLSQLFFFRNHTQKSAYTSKKKKTTEKKNEAKNCAQPNHADWGEQKESLLNCPCFTYKSGRAYLHTLGHIIFDALLQCADMRSHINRNAFHIHTMPERKRRQLKIAAEKSNLCHFECERLCGSKRGKIVQRWD